MTQRKKNNIIIGSLCVVVLLMAVGYAAFSSILNIKGTSSISSNWKVLITNVDEKNIVGSATNAEEPSWEDLTATFKTNLVSPGDSIEYDITIENRGNLNATLDKITLSDSNNEAIKFTSSGLEEGSELNAGDSATLTVKVEYDNNVTSQPESTEGTFTVTLDYSQKEGGGVVSQTAAEKLIATATDSGDGLYADEYEPGRYVYKGGNPNNYITFNNESWRILSVENDGTLKIMRGTSIGSKEFDSQNYRDENSNGAGGTYCAQSSYGCNAWAIVDNFENNNISGTVLRDAEINTYLNESYYSSLTETAQIQIQSYNWDIGPVAGSGENGAFNLSSMVTNSKKYLWNGNVALFSPIDFLKANSNVDKCLTSTNISSGECDSTNYISVIVKKLPNQSIRMLSPYLWDASSVWYLYGVYGGVDLMSSAARVSVDIFPTLYLKSNISLDGEGTSSNPYTIVS
ncbi:MAG: hypothetical protein HFH45_00315 [Bacilli bacterium]|nr:hypothetical protein [Bacilli bacterium]